MLSVTKLIGMLIVAVGLMGAGAYTMHKVDLGTINGLKAQYAQAEAAALQKAQEKQKELDEVTAAASTKAVADQAALVAAQQQSLARIPAHVTVIKGPGNCVTYGLVRVLDAAVFGSDPAKLNLPAGATDATCAPVDAPALARTIVTNYGRYKITAQQLTDLQAWARSIAAVK